MWIKTKFLNLKSKIKEYFLMKNSLDHLSNILNKFYIFSIGFIDIYYGNKNTKRFKICIAIWAMAWFTGFYLLSFVLSDDMFSLMDIHSISDEHLKMLIILFIICTFLVGVFRTDYLLGETEYNLSQLKVIYYLKMNFRRKHKLNDKYHKKLSILSRITQLMLLDCGTILFSLFIFLFFVKMAILSNGKLFWTSAIVILTPILTIIEITGTTTVCLSIIVFAYYTMIFDQINHKINLLSNEKSTFFKRKLRIVNKTIESQINSLIDQHNISAIEIYKINLMIRKSLAAVFVSFAIFKIISFYLLFNFNEFIIRLFLIQFTFLIISFGFGGCYLFTRQIKSAHKPLKTVHSIFCKYEMDLSLKVKVS